LAVVHVKVAEPPALIVTGAAESEAVGDAAKFEDGAPEPQPDRSPAQIHAATKDKRFLAKCTLHSSTGSNKGSYFFKSAEAGKLDRTTFTRETIVALTAGWMPFL
jgi:hypothetical protein